MSKILVSGLVNVETTCRIGQFPIDYQPIDYNFFGVNSAVAGVGFNVAKALHSLGDIVEVATLTGEDVLADVVRNELKSINADKLIQQKLKQTPQSVVLFDDEGKRRISCDLKDIQEKEYNFENIRIEDYDLVAACNINYSRPLLKKAKKAGIKICTDVHVLSNVEDEYNKEFMEYADILFLNNEAVIGCEKQLLQDLSQRYHNEIIVMGCGNRGAIMYARENETENQYYEQSAVVTDKIINTVGAGDALFSAFVSLYANGYSPLDSLTLAQKFAAYKIGFDGAAKGFLTMKELVEL